MELANPIVLIPVALAAFMASAYAHDNVFAFHMGLVSVLAATLSVWRLTTSPDPRPAAPSRADTTSGGLPRRS